MRISHLTCCLMLALAPLFQGCASLLYPSDKAHTTKIQTNVSFVSLTKRDHYSIQNAGGDIFKGARQLLLEFTPLGYFGPKFGYPELISSGIVGTIAVTVVDKFTGRKRPLSATIEFDGNVPESATQLEIPEEDDLVASVKSIEVKIKCKGVFCTVTTNPEISSIGQIETLYTGKFLDESGGFIVWKNNALSSSLTDEIAKAPEGRALDNTLNLARRYIQDDAEKWVGGKPSLPRQLEQDKYERRSDFEQRAERERAQYAAAVSVYSEKLQSYPKSLRNNMIGKALNTILGSPKILSTHYDPETQTFFADVTTNSSWAKGFKQTFVLSGHVPNNEASKFDERLQLSEIEVRFKIEHNVLSVDSALFGKNLTALPVSGNVRFDSKQINVSLEDLRRSAQLPTSPALPNVQYADDPEIGKKTQELFALRRAKAKDLERKELESEIARLKSETTVDIHSDVDGPFQSTGKATEDFAVLIGIDEYQDSQLPKAKFAERDVAAMRANLLALGIPERNIKILTGHDATRAKVDGIVKDWLPRNSTPRSKVYFYFSGHGAPDPTTGDAYLLPWDGDPTTLRETGVLIPQLYKDLSHVTARHRIAFLDACFSGSGDRSLVARGIRPLIVVKQTANVPPDLTVLAAAAENQISGIFEAQGHGLFTYYLLRAMREDKKTTTEIYHYLKPKVQDEASRSSRTQVPVLLGQETTIP